MAQVDTPEVPNPGSPAALEEEKPDLYEKLVGPLPPPARLVINFLATSALLYVFLLGLDLLGNILTQAFGAGLLLSLSDRLADAIVRESASTFKSSVKIIVGPVSKLIISIDKDIIKGIAKGCLSCAGPSVEADFCKDDSRKDRNGNRIKNCVSRAMWEETYKNGQIVKGGLAKEIGGIDGSVVVLVIALNLLAFAVYGILRILLSSVRMQTEDGSDTLIVRWTRKVLRMRGETRARGGALGGRSALRNTRGEATARGGAPGGRGARRRNRRVA